jgi:hypothetical protein
VPTHLQVDELAEHGWVRITKLTGDKGRIFAVTGDGRRAWADYTAMSAHTPGFVELDWPAARPVLERLYAMYKDAGAPEKGVDVLPLVEDSEAGRQNQAVIGQIVRSGLLEVVFEGAAGPRTVRPSPDTFRMLAGWPSGSGDDALNELVAALNAQIEQTTDAGEKSRLAQLRDGLLGVGRQLFLSWAENKTKGIG